MFKVPSFRAGLLLSALLANIFAGARADIVVPPSMIQKQAERDQQAADATGNHPRDQHKQLEELRAAALGDDAAAVMPAIHALRSMGDPARQTLREVVRKLLARDRAVFDAVHTLPSAADLKAESDHLADERKAARVNIDKLAHDQTLKIAHQHYDSLKASWEKMRGAFAEADAVTAALSRRGQLLTLWRDLMPADKQYSDGSEARLIPKIEHALGFTVAQMTAIPDIGAGNAPAEPVLRDLCFYRACRRIEAYNATVQKCMSDPELENARMVNGYREYLGIFPYEFDPRLVNSARGHSKEMVELKYFAHDSPVPGNKTPWDRIRKAGYAGGSGENIAFGVGKGDEAFWMWFDSPCHHQNMASLGSTALGVGNVAVTWTQNMGSARRLMLASPEDRKAALANAKTPAKNG